MIGTVIIGVAVMAVVGVVVELIDSKAEVAISNRPVSEKVEHRRIMISMITSLRKGICMRILFDTEVH